MRRDIAKVVFERAKSGRTWASKTPRPRAVMLDLAGQQFDESSNDVRRKRQKTRNKNLGPLKNFLKCRVGRPWDAVWTEICAATGAGDPLGDEVRKCFGYLVRHDCWIEVDTIMIHSWCGPPTHKVRGFYLHPRSGLLCRAPEGE
jgi:hypothetical protein